IYHQISISQTFQSLGAFLTRSTAINNVILISAFLCVIILLRKIYRKRKMPDNIFELITESIAMSIGTSSPVVGKSSSEKNHTYEKELPLPGNFRNQRGEAIASIVDDGYYGKAIVFHNNISDEAWDYRITPADQEVNQISYIFIPTGEFIFYVKVALQSANGNATVIRWIGLRQDIFEISGNPDQAEMTTPSYSKPEKGDWQKTTIDLYKLISKTYGINGWRYHSIESIRIRGMVKISQIRFRYIAKV
ncbi:MAG TPA: hypothetical protein VNX68_08430, partial [Nitrosopumilaceae archaeon]|nr:hypothetical protein [Nitrosopumilaceae archaeon]